MNKDEEKLALYRPYPGAKLNPCSDEIFKALFTDESEEARIALRCFLTAVLHKEVKDVVLKPNEPAIIDDHDKAVRFDVSCTFNDGESADIEMQGVNEDNAYGKRAEYLCARLLNSGFHRGNSWVSMKRVYQISLLNFIFDKKDASSVSHYQMKKENGQTLSETQTVIFLELPKIDKLGDVSPKQLNSEQRWCKFLLDADNPVKNDYVKKLAADEGGIMEAQKTLDRISEEWILWKRELDKQVIECDRNTEREIREERERRNMEKSMETGLQKGIQKGLEQGLQQGLQQGMQQGMQQGLQQGLQQGILQTARNLKSLQVPIETIIKSTGLSEDEIAKL